MIEKVTVAAEPLSPELVLVCPELRERAELQLMDLPWQVTPQRIVPLPWHDRKREPSHLLGIAQMAAAAVGAATTLTLALTLIADAVAVR